VPPDRRPALGCAAPSGRGAVLRFTPPGLHLSLRRFDASAPILEFLDILIFACEYQNRKVLRIIRTSEIKNQLKFPQLTLNISIIMNTFQASRSKTIPKLSPANITSVID
jgi:hypothetical protein